MLEESEAVWLGAANSEEKFNSCTVALFGQSKNSVEKSEIVLSYCPFVKNQIFLNANIPLHFKVCFSYSVSIAVSSRIRSSSMLTSLCILEPMLTMGSTQPVIWSDEWTAVTKDGSLSAQFEHTLLITENGAEILTKC
ncbi:hypothetical protein M5K25_018352 [Dendrobium thyrsiflorum]|uniref:Methionine aminopeptidase n=1 Tax=Dendrobium thyrsiflorum TaxID=117978 RepID=A0ABD0UHR3_DENTH